MRWTLALEDGSPAEAADAEGAAAPETPAAPAKAAPKGSTAVGPTTAAVARDYTRDMAQLGLWWWEEAALRFLTCFWILMLELLSFFLNWVILFLKQLEQGEGCHECGCCICGRASVKHVAGWFVQDQTLNMRFPISAPRSNGHALTQKWNMAPNPRCGKADGRAVRKTGSSGWSKFHTFLAFSSAVGIAFLLGHCSHWGQQLETNHHHTWECLEKDLTAQVAGREDARMLALGYCGDVSCCGVAGFAGWPGAESPATLGRVTVGGDGMFI